jgi:putative chitinase
MINRIAFFNRLRTHNLYTKLNQGHVDGFNAILDEWECNPLNTDLRQLAYILGTIYHEVDKTMQPIEEYGKGRGKDYGKKLKYGNGPGKRIPYVRPDHLYYGRGLTQNTWYEIYQKLSQSAKAKAMGWDFLNNPSLLLTLKPSAWASIYAMTTGLYTGKKLSNYFNLKVCNWKEARRIVNGLDKASLIAVYAKKFYECVK